MIEQLGITPYVEETFTLLTVATSGARWEMFLLASMGKARTVATIFGEPTDTPLLGVAALEILGYAIDPRTRKLEPTKMLLP